MLTVKIGTLGKGIFTKLPMMDILIRCMVASSQNLYKGGAKGTN